jgi:hypothetical protein
MLFIYLYRQNKNMNAVLVFLLESIINNTNNIAIAVV